tara:strand:+ start:5009 stop:5647 length:639 start_codon:yes stop_codon:yes gene_type:complete
LNLAADNELSTLFSALNEGSMAKLYFYYSAMNAGKSTVLLQTDYNYRERGMATLIYTPSIDDRYERNQVTSRIGLKAAARPFDDGFDFFQDVQREVGANAGMKMCVLVDEAHFLKKQQVEQLCRVADQLGIPVLCYGLRSDFLGEPFEGSQYLLVWADKLVELKTVCHCGKKATMNMRITADGQKVTEGSQIEIGGNDLYISTCRRHFTEPV